VFNCLSGFYRPTSGRICLNDRVIDHLPDYRISRLGLIRTFQHVRLFKQMTVIENLLVAQHRLVNTRLLSGLFKTPDYRLRERDALERTWLWLERLNLSSFANRAAGTLAYGPQRLLEIARCMVAEPTLLLLDEPAAGLNPKETHDMDRLIMQLRDEFNLSILLIEHDMKLVMGISDQVYVMNQGRPLAQGSPEEICKHPEVINAYLGES
jgi:branched-chain amino acid transport system ATP-binding protein